MVFKRTRDCLGQGFDEIVEVGGGVDVLNIDGFGMLDRLTYTGAKGVNPNDRWL